MRKIYIYKLTSDDGGAPCVYDDILTLAICKPAIRSTASEESVILGFAANYLKPRYTDNCLIYMAEVTKKLDARDYFSEERYASRPDCIYRWNEPRFEWKKNRFHSSDRLVHDLGSYPAYERANVLLSNKFRYFGTKCPIRYKAKYPRLKSLVEKLGQGSRVHHNPELQEELRKFIRQVWKTWTAYSTTPALDTSKHKCGSHGYAKVEC